MTTLQHRAKVGDLSAREQRANEHKQDIPLLPSTFFPLIHSTDPLPTKLAKAI